jgi:hypothetical protein
MKSFCTLLCALIAFSAAAQVSINSTGSGPDPKAMLDVSSTDKGFLPPRMTTAQRDAISSPLPEGLIVYNTDSDCLNIWDGAVWKENCSECSFSLPVVSGSSPVCAEMPLSFSASYIAGATYSWTGPNGFTSTDQSPVITSPTTAASGEYILTVTKDGCTTRPIRLYMTVKPKPNSPATGNNAPFCEGGTLNLTASTIPGATYFWTGPGFNSYDQNPQITNATTAQNGTYAVYAYLNGCASNPAFTNVTINAIPPTPGWISGNETPAPGSTQSYSISSVPGASTYTWSVPSGGTIDSGQGTTAIQVTFGANSGNVSVTAGNECGTSSASSKYVSVIVTKKVFVTSQTWDGNLGGLSGADTKCQTAASNAGLSGTYKAWLSSGVLYATSRLNHSPYPYVRTDGATIANDWNDLTNEDDIQNPIDKDEFGNTVGSPQSAHSYTYPNGQGVDSPGAPFYCSDWTTSSNSQYTRYGSTTETYQWSDINWGFCNTFHRLYCFEQ